MKVKYDIKGRYPCKANWVVLKKHDDMIIARNCAVDEDIELSPRKARYLQMLDGYTNPYEVNGYSYEECSDYYGELDSELLVRKGKSLDLGGSSIYTVFIPKHMRTKSVVPKIYNFLLMMLCVPVFLLGVSTLFNGSIRYISEDFFALGMLVGLVIGGTLHEISHAMSCLAFGGRFIEGGLMLNGILPGAYCMIDDTTVGKKNNKLKLVQISMAGAEMNLLLSGLFFWLISLAEKVAFLLPWTGMFCMVAVQNLIFVLLNLTFVKGLDGEHVVSLLLGKGSIVTQALANIRCMFGQKKRRKYFKTMGINGAANICTSCVIVLFQAVTPILILAEIVYVIGGAFGWIIDIIF